MELHPRKKLHSFPIRSVDWRALDFQKWYFSSRHVGKKITFEYISRLQSWESRFQAIDHTLRVVTVQPRQVGIWRQRIPSTLKNFVSCHWLCTNSLPSRCSVNATPQQIPQAARAVEKFVKTIARSKKEQKTVRPYVVEVRGKLSLSFLVSWELALLRSVEFTSE